MQDTRTAVAPFSIGGQAVIEGVMMRSPSAIATAVRKADGDIQLTHRPFRGVACRYRFLDLPVLRGTVNLIETLWLGMQALSWSAEQSMEESGRGEAVGGETGPGEEAATEREGGRPRASGNGWSSLTIALTMTLALAAGVGLFFYLPLVLTERLGVENGIAFNLVDGLIRLAILLAYLWAISRWKEMGRVFQYHGAEHKSIFVFEGGLPLVPESSRRFTTFHPRCGTSFLLLVVLTSIVVFAFLGRPTTPGERLLRLACVPFIGGVAYELIKLSGKPRWQGWLGPVILPGLWLQRITTQEPTLDQVEVAMEAVKACLAYESPAVESPQWSLQEVPAGA